MVDDQRSGSVKFTGELDCDGMLYMILIVKMLGSDLTPEAPNLIESLVVTTKSENLTSCTIASIFILNFCKHRCRVVRPLAL